MKFCIIGNNLTSLILAYILSKKNIHSEIYSIKSSKFYSKIRREHYKKTKFKKY